MARKTLALAAMVAGLVGILVTGLGSGTGSATHLGVPHTFDPQQFLVDNLVCRGGTSDVDGSEDANTFPTAGIDCSGENLTAGALNQPQHQDTIIAKGNRLSLGINWSDQAFGVETDLNIANGTQTGDVIAAINIGCDDTIDYFLDNSADDQPGWPLDGGFADPAAIPEQFNEQTTTFTATSGFGSSSEEFLNAVLPATFSKVVRYRADVNFVTLGEDLGVPLANPVSLNAVVMDAPFGSARASITLLGGDATAPSSQLTLCLDSPQTSIATIDADGGLDNPGAGLYAGWTSYISAAGVRDETAQVLGYVTNCKDIGGAVADADNDCLSDAADANDADEDQDNDGLLDGIDATYVGASFDCDPGAGVVSPVNDPDCDNDGQSDFEEMLQVAAALTDPTDPDTDGDGWTDSGLQVDCGSDGVPDSVADISLGDDTIATEKGRNRVMYNLQYCKAVAGVGGRPVGNPNAAAGVAETACGADIVDNDGDQYVNDGCPAVGGAETVAQCRDLLDNDTGGPDGAINDGCASKGADEDNCPTQANANQANTSYVDRELDASVPTDTNGRFAGPHDFTHPDTKYTGDACDGDDDNDGVPDSVEGTMFYDATGGTSNLNFCNTAGLGVAAVTLINDPDTDNDGRLDGTECQLSSDSTPSNPADGTSRHTAAFSTDQNIFFRLIQLTQFGTTMEINLDDSGENPGPPGPASCGDALDSDGDAIINDGCPIVGAGPEGTVAGIGACADALDNGPEGVDGTINDGCPAVGLVAGASEARGLGAGAASSNDTDRDGCLDEVELVDVDGSRTVADADRIAIARAVLGQDIFAPDGSETAEEIRTADIDQSGGLADADRILAARLVLRGSLAAIPDYNGNCLAAGIGYDAN